LCKEHAGGLGAPYIMQTSHYAKKLGCTARMGEKVTHALATAGGRPLTRVRWAFVHALLTSDTVVDGVFELFKHQLIAHRLNAKYEQVVDNKGVDVHGAEAALQKAEKFCKQLSGTVPHDLLVEVEGAFFTRIGLYLGICGERGIDGRKYKDLNDVKSLFAEHLDLVIKDANAMPSIDGKKKKNISSPCTWSPPIAGDRKSKDAKDVKLAAVEASKQTAAGAESKVVANASDSSHIFYKGGFTIGGLCLQKTVKEPFVIESLVGDRVTVKGTSLFNPPFQATVDVSLLVTDFKPYFGEIQTKLKVGVLSVVGGHTKVQIDVARSSFWKLLVAKAPTKVDARIGFFLNPQELRTTVFIKAGALKLWPYTHMQCVKHNSEQPKGRNPTQHAAEFGDTTWYLSPPPCPRSTEVCKWADDVVIVPFWWVCVTKTVSVNMKLELAKLEDGGTCEILVR
jgi:hypothetical protein